LFKRKQIQPTTQASSQIAYILYGLQNSGKSADTIKSINKSLTLLARNTNLNKPKQVLNFIANRNVTNGTKQSLCYAYKKYCKQYQIEAQIPFYQPKAKPIKLPTKEKLLIFITNASKRLATKLTLSMETGLRPIEVHSLKVKDIDLEQRLVYPTTAKHGAPRTLKISMQLATMLQEHIIKKQLNQNDIIFPNTTEQYGKNFRHLRNRLAKKLHDPTLKNIRLYDFRHYFCTKKLYDTRNTFIVMNLMGHKRLETTQKYMHLLNLIEDNWIGAEANTKEEALKLIDNGFEYVTDFNGTKLFRKRK
jgi:integrase